MQTNTKIEQQGEKGHGVPELAPAEAEEKCDWCDNPVYMSYLCRPCLTISEQTEHAAEPADDMAVEKMLDDRERAQDINSYNHSIW